MTDSDDSPTMMMGFALMHLMESVRSIPDAMSSYRESCMEAGFSEAAAEQMAVQLHSSLMAGINRESS
ncbi:MAG: hypothetical protein IPG97_13155 [Microthrixaceae bacterium]|nr:hypothetical protein [Microthrixaceae bacterium]